MEFLSEKEAEDARKRLDEELSVDIMDATKEYSSYKLNWKSNLKSWDEAKGFMCDGYSLSPDGRLFFVGHDNDKIIGKPQLIHETIQRIPLVRTVSKIERNNKADERIITQHKFIDERVDKRYDGKIVATLNMDFWVYKIIYEGREYYVLSQEKMGNEVYMIEGMKISMDDFSELTNSLKVNAISNLFIAKKSESFIKTINPTELVKFCKEKEINKEKFHNLVFMHPSGVVYDYSEDFNILRKAQLLSGKYEGYPLHIFKMGPVGTGKTTESEVLDFKFQEEQGILEAANSTLKSIVPSFKEKPANLGYICKCNRFALIDEMMKMVESAMGHDNSRVSNYFGQMNMLLEQKDRMVGSGNDNSARVKSTAKLSITTNNINNRFTISNHLGIIDPTTLSRMLVWVQDYKEIAKIYEGLCVKIPPTQSQELSRETPFLEDIYTRLCVGGINGNDFLTIYDSCQKFLVDFDINQCKKIFDRVTKLISGKMQQVWRARGMHHTILVLDGITKNRCLFEDYDDSFNCKDIDYQITEKILVHMANSWETSYDPLIMERDIKND